MAKMRDLQRPDYNNRRDQQLDVSVLKITRIANVLFVVKFSHAIVYWIW